MWDKKHKQYFNRDLRNQTFELMFEIYRELGNNIDLANFKKKIENMRTSYSRELKKVNASKQTGSGIDDVYKPSLWYYTLFAFYEETTEPTRKGTDTLDAGEVLRELWFQRLPQQVQGILTAQSDLNLDKVAELADKILEK
ncbi:uncharacterized protein LOC133525244 [Cydia pomonella]|uniref:uncharacterized protein LOC133525244 n=1 Tax=Cydia pomonella TaxID=82600 RepID=UPI002ADD3519|nr:uncharacterized protein LOC133525244 [Cydia pomonella]